MEPVNFLGKMGGGQLTTFKAPPLPTLRFTPGYLAAKPTLGQNFFEQLLESPWLGVGLEAATGAGLLALGLAVEGWPAILALLGAAYWLYRAVAGGYAAVKPAETAAGVVV